MHQGVDRPEVTPRGRAVEGDHDSGNGTPSETDTNQMSWQEVEPVGDEVAEGARGPAHAREDGDLRGPGGHRS
jgi:hypothetical protein